MTGSNHQAPRRILIASANPLFSKGLQRLFAEWWSQPSPEVRLANSMKDTVEVMHSWVPDLVVVDYDDRTINRAEFLNHYVESDVPMQVMLVSLQESGEVVIYDRRTMSPAEVSTWFRGGAPVKSAEPPPEPKRARAVFLQPRWIILTLLVIAAIGVFVRLGFWQLDRLAQRRESNAQMQAQINQPELDLNTQMPAPDALAGMEFRAVTATGTFDPTGEVVLRNQRWENEVGVHVLTPLVLPDGSRILVDRGWIPYVDSGAAARQKYAVAGTVTMSGMLRASQSLRGQAQIAPDSFAEVNIDTISRAVGQNLLPLYMIAAPLDGTQPTLPYRSLPEVEFSEGSHLGYAMQWFFFAVLLVVGYPIFLRKQMQGQHLTGSSNALAGSGVQQKNV